MQSQQPVQQLPTTTELSLIQRLLAHSFASSYEHNLRNIEHPWYGFWSHILIDIVKDTRNLVIFPQFVVWASPEGYKDLDAEKLKAVEEPEQEQELEQEQESEQEETQRELEAPRQPQTRSQTKRQQELVKLLQVTKQAKKAARNVPVVGIAQPAQDPVGENAPTTVHTHTSMSTASSSMGGSVATVSLPKGSSTRIADFAILKFRDSITSANTNPTKPEHIKTTSCKVKLLVEIKRLASRGLEREEFQDQIEEMTQVAIYDVYAQAALLFEKNKDVKSVIAIAASGNYWCHAVLKRENIKHDAFKEMSIDLSYNEEYVAPFWTPPTPLEDSLEELQKLFNAVRTG